MRAYRVLLFIIFCISMLALLGFFFPREGVEVAGVQWRFLHPSALLKKDTTEVPNLDTILRRTLAADKLANLKSLSDSFAAYTYFATHSPSRIHYPEKNLKFFDEFFATMENARVNKKTVRILHYGDSQIEMDRITAVIREQLQKMFGGKGPGLIPAIQTIPSGTISQWYSGGLAHYAVYGMQAARVEHRRYGLLCQMSTVNGQASIGFRKGYAALPNASSFTRVKLLIGNNRPGFTAELFTGETSRGVQSLEDSTSGVRILEWQLKGIHSRGQLMLNGHAEIYGIALDGNYGVAMDNIPMRGSTGEVFTGINSSMLAQSYEKSEVVLIIMQFGGNAMPGIKSAARAEWYGGVMGKQILHLQKIYPKAHILFIGPSDMSKNIDGSMQTWPFLPEVRDALKREALENGAAFWDMFEAMGGINSMPVWVNASPQLAAPDYIHFTPRGAQKVSEMLLNAFLNDFQLYELRRKAAEMARKTNPLK